VAAAVEAARQRSGKTAGLYGDGKRRLLETLETVESSLRPELVVAMALQLHSAAPPLLILAAAPARSMCGSIVETASITGCPSLYV